MNNIDKEQIIKLIEAGIQASSADNGQPWKFKLLENGFELWLDPDNMGLFFDVNQVATLMSCGAVIENVNLLATAMGFATQINYFFNNPEIINEGSGAPANKIAELTFTPTADGVSVQETTQTIYNRHTNRNLFKFNKTIPDSVIAELTNLVHADENYRLYAYQAPKNKKAIIQTITATDTIRFIHEQVHNDFYKVLRFGRTAAQTRDGLASATLGIEGFMIPILQLLKPWKLVKLLNYIGLHHIMAFRGTWLPMKSSSLIVSIVHKGPVNYVDSGRIMQRFWLEANKVGLSVQALGALPLFLARLHLIQGEGFTPVQVKTLSSLENNFVKITPEFDQETDQLVMMFRLGFTKQTPILPYRRSIESFIVQP